MLLDYRSLITAAKTVAPYFIGYFTLRTLYKWFLRYRSPIAAFRYNFKDKVALITGASSGLGRSIATELHRCGAKVILLARSIDQLNQTCNELKKLHPDNVNEPVARYIDMADPNNLDDLIKVIKSTSAGELHIIVNNAGIAVHSSCSETSIETHRNSMQVNYFGAVQLTQALLPHVADDGCIVAITSVQSRFAIPRRSAYGASKHAMQAYFDTLRAELRGRVQVLCVQPGYIATNLGSNSVSGSGQKLNASNDHYIRNGMKSEYVAKEILHAIRCGEHELFISRFSPHLAAFMRYVLPDMFFYAMAKRELMEH